MGEGKEGERVVGGNRWLRRRGEERGWRGEEGKTG